MCRYLCSFFLFVWFFSGCGTVPHPTLNKTDQLAHLLAGLDRNIPQPEAEALAADIVRETDRLERVFDRSTLPWFHNFMVTVGIKKQGLCYHYSDGLYRYLKTRHYPHFTFHLAGAHIGEYWREHNALVILPRRKIPFGEGIVIDPWRKQGSVFVSKVKDDPNYRWHHRHSREIIGEDRSYR
ncbi:MAG: hypothetical protein L3J47_00795 [Sulfurovum sp.]|nr:hypothetical protein [Sulfurovum sp.]